MLQKDEGILALKLARTTITNYLTNTKQTHPSHPDKFKEKSGVFVTLHTYPKHLLRGCIGIPYPIMPLHKAIQEAAVSVTHDPRFNPLQKEELTTVLLEITILTPPELLSIQTPEEYLSKIKIGRDGLIVEKGYFKGLLLPQVPIEQGWDTEEFLIQACQKAGLNPDAWIDNDTKIYRFSGQIFYEISPNGDIEEKHSDGSDN